MERAPKRQVEAQKRNQASIKPISIAPDQSWLGNDGPWSTFSLGYGTPSQYIHSLASTSIPQPYVVIPGGCLSSDPSDCSAARGNIFYPNTSSTWQSLGDYTLVFEGNLGINSAGNFAFESITLGLPGTNGASYALGQQIVTGIITKDYFVATWGLRPAPTNFTDLNSPIPSLLEDLKADGKISSLSWAYTAGSYQQSMLNKNGMASLTIGGYDASQFAPSNVTFDFAADTSRDLVVSILAIETEEGSNSLLGTPILSFLDSSVSHIWLPEDSCQRFQTAFNLTYSDKLDLYTVDSTVHEVLKAQNANITFTLSNDLTISTSATPVTIVLPYSAFDLELTNEYPDHSDLENVSYYFPIRRASNETQYTLGRTFFQHAYVIADYERSVFSVHQALFPTGGVEQDLQPIWPIGGTNSSNSTSNSTSTNLSNGSTAPTLSPGALAGIIVATVVCSLAIILGAVYAWRKRRRSLGSGASQGAPVVPMKSELDSKSNMHLGVQSPELHGHDAPMRELMGRSMTQELPGEEEKGRASLERETERREMPG